MHIVTGGAGFIGNNLVRALNRRDEKDVIVVDDLTDGRKALNLTGCDIADYLDKDDFIDRFEAGGFADASVVYHNGACSDTGEWDGRRMMALNYDYSKRILHACVETGIPLVYASSASVYGNAAPAIEPMNPYASSKALFDNYAIRHRAAGRSTVVGLRYFNVYGPREAHKDAMASVVHQFYQQARRDHRIRLFGAAGGYAAGEQERDFVYVDDVVNVGLWAATQTGMQQIFDVGTGSARSFNAIAKCLTARFEATEVEYIDFPERLLNCYQFSTQADLTPLRSAGYDRPFTPLEDGVSAYLDWLEQSGI